MVEYFGYEIIRRTNTKRNNSFDALSIESNLLKFIKLTEGMITFEEANLLYQLAKTTKENCIIEVGSYRGRSTVALGRGSIDGYGVPVFAIEPHEEFKGVLGVQFGAPDRGAFYKAMLDTSCYHVVRLINLSSEIVAPNWDNMISLLWIDGDHTYEGVRRDVDSWLPHLAKGAIIAFDDSTDPKLGPNMIINELIATRNFKKINQVGKVSVIRSTAG